MRGSSWRAGLSSLGAVVVLSNVGLVSGHSQLVMEQTFYMETSACEGVSCRKEIIGANETLGVGAVDDCSHNTTYWHEDLDQGEFVHVRSVGAVWADGRVGGWVGVVLFSFDSLWGRWHVKWPGHLLHPCRRNRYIKVSFPLPPLVAPTISGMLPDCSKVPGGGGEGSALIPACIA